MKAEWFTIYGECEAVAAEHMVQQGKASYLGIDVRDLPPNKFGHPARRVVSIPRRHLAEFHALCADLRA